MGIVSFAEQLATAVGRMDPPPDPIRADPMPTPTKPRNSEPWSVPTPPSEGDGRFRMTASEVMALESMDAAHAAERARLWGREGGQS